MNVQILKLALQQMLQQLENVDNDHEVNFVDQHGGEHDIHDINIMLIDPRGMIARDPAEARVVKIYIE